ncbi:putative lipoprotein [Bacteroides fragilis str. S6L5]|nr:putative lipoprotein [Bacteroides fragilis str. S6L5]
MQMNFKKYEDQVTEQDKKDISFVVAAAAEKSSISLAMSQAELKTALHRIKELHPLALLKFVAENSSLIEGMKKMQSRDWIWNMFLNELKEVFSQAVAQGIISDEDINDFASSLHLDKEIVSSVVQGEKWPELLDMVMQIS